MDTSDVILCTACFLKVKVIEDILMCNGCKLWQHRTCASDVAASFYRDFYLSVIKGNKPKQWTCNYCSKNTSQVKSESQGQPISTTPNPPPTSQSCSDSDCSDYEEFALSQEIQRETGEGLASLTTSLDVTTSTTPSRLLHVSSAVPDQHHKSTFDTSRFHNTAYYEDSILDTDSELNITPAALRLPENPTTTSQKELHYNTAMSCDRSPPRSLLSATYTLDHSSSDSDNEMSSLDPPPTPSTIPYCHSDRSFSDSESEVEFPPTRRVSIAPPPTRDTRGTSSQRDNTRTEGREPDSDSSDDDQHDRRVPPFRWGLSSDSSSNSEDDIPAKMFTPSALQFRLTTGPVSGGQTTLQDSQGYTYSVKFKIGVNTFWCCTEKSTRCQATAIQNRNIITQGAAKHNHKPRAVPQDMASPAVENNSDRFRSLTPEQDKTSGQPPKPHVEMINVGTTDYSYILVDSHGFVYHDKETSHEARQTTWTCTKKTKLGICTGSIRLGCNFLVVKAHNHPGDMKKVTELRVKSKIKTCILANPAKTPAQILAHILLELGLTRQSLTKAGYQALMKQTRKQKQGTRH